MGVEIWLIAVITGIIFCVSFYALGWDHEKKNFLEREQCRFCQKSQEHTVGLAGFDPFLIVKQVASRAKISTPELYIVDNPGYAHIFQIGEVFVIVCNSSFLKSLSAEEFEGVAGHEIGHVFDFWLRVLLHRVLFGLFTCLIFFGTAFFIRISLFLWMPQCFVENDPFDFAVLFCLVCFMALTVTCFIACYGCDIMGEFRADRRSLLRFTHYPEDFVNVLSRLAGKEEFEGAFTKRFKTAERILSEMSAAK